jgi:hypothetical protein
MSNVEWGTNVAKGPPGTTEPLINGTGLQGLSTGGPVVMFDPYFNSLVVAPMDNFKNAVHHIRRPLSPSPSTSSTTHMKDQAIKTYGNHSRSHPTSTRHAETSTEPLWEMGVSSELTDLPSGFEHRTMLVAGRGITATLDTWGKALRKVYRTNRSVEVCLPNPSYFEHARYNVTAAYDTRDDCVVSLC